MCINIQTVLNLKHSKFSILGKTQLKGKWRDAVWNYIQKKQEYGILVFKTFVMRTRIIFLCMYKIPFKSKCLHSNHKKHLRRQFDIVHVKFYIRNCDVLIYRKVHLVFGPSCWMTNSLQIVKTLWTQVPVHDPCYT